MQNQAGGGGAHGETGGESPAIELLRDALASTLVAVVANGNSREEIRQAVRPVCARAREEKMDVAELVKAVKHILASSTVGARLDGGERQQVLDRIISVCIDEYYAAG